MAAAAPVLRVIEGGREPRAAVGSAPELYGLAAVDRIPRPRRGLSSLQIATAFLISASLHAGAIWWWAQHASDDEARAAGGADSTIIIEGESVILVDSVPSEASDALPEARPANDAQVASLAMPETLTPSTDTQATPVAEAKATAAESSAKPIAGTPLPATSVAPVPSTTATVTPADARRVASADDTLAAAADAPAARVASEAAAAKPADTPAGTIVDPPDRRAADTPSTAVVADALASPVGEASLTQTESAAPTATVPEQRAATLEDRRLLKAEADRPEPGSDLAAARSDDDHVRPAATDDLKIAAIEDATTATAEDVAIAATEAEPAPLPQPRAKPAAPPKPAPRSEQRAASVANDAARGPLPGTAGAGGASSEESGRADLSSYQAKLAAHLRRYRTFPAEARDKGITGTAIVRFTVNRSGSVTGASLAKTSGAAVLDQAAVAMVHRASPFPPIPSGYGSASLTVNVPVRFDLR